MKTDASTKSNVNWFNFTGTSSKDALDKNDITYDNVIAAIGPSSAAAFSVESAKLILNGNDRFAARDGKYFSIVQPFQHHENVPNNVGINVYSFALKPEEHQPSGTLNMSRIDSATLDITYTTGITAATSDISVYAVNYNVLRILSGMGGIAYSN